MSRSGDPHIAKSTANWTTKNASWKQPVQNSLPELKHLADPSMAVKSYAEEVTGVQMTHGQFNTGNGGVWPKGYVKA